jgi:hypothetical protein
VACAAVVDAAAAVGVAAADGGNRRTTMAKINKFTAACTLVVAMGAGIAAATGESQQVFTTPQQGFDALVAAIRANDIKTLKTILGPEGDAIVQSGDPAADQQGEQAFIAEYDAHSTIEQPDPNRATLSVGADNWPMPIPLVKGKSGWQFDAAAGKQELLARRIGRNELYTIQACLAYVDAQREYAQKDRGDKVLDYAQHFISSPGKQDGLYWPTAEGQPESPLGPAFAAAQTRGYDLAKAKAAGVGGQTPFNGYYFRILNGQGASAPGGAYSYMAGNKMIGGFALIAYPVQYGNSGVMTFLVNHDGIVYQKDLGPDTTSIAEGMKTFDPGKGWTKSAST